MRDGTMPNSPLEHPKHNMQHMVVVWAVDVRGLWCVAREECMPPQFAKALTSCAFLTCERLQMGIVCVVQCIPGHARALPHRQLV